MPVKIQIGEEIISAYLSGEIDHHTAQTVRRVIDGTAERRKPKLLVLDFTGVTFMDSSGIGVIIGRYKQIRARGGKTLIIRAKPQVDKLLELSGIKKIIETSKGGRQWKTI